MGKKAVIVQGSKAVIHAGGVDMFDEALHEARWRLNEGQYIRFDGADKSRLEDAIVEELWDFVELVEDGADGFRYVHRRK